MYFDRGSFRDPSGRVMLHENRVFRVIYEQGLANYRAAKDAGIYEQMADKGFLLPATSLTPDANPAFAELSEGARELLEHPKLDYVSYPYEWCFAELKAAALHHLNFHIELLKRGFNLSDATAYNVQFQGTRPVFIDHLSIIPYEEGTAWIGQRQFGMQFLNPLFLWAKKGIAPHAWYRGSVDGIEPEELAKLLGWKDRLSFNVLAHIIGPAAFARRRVSDGLDAKPVRETRLAKNRFVALLTSLRDYISGLNLPDTKTVWDDYADNNSYDEARRGAKHQFVADAVAAATPDRAIDIGCNSGDFSQTAIEAGARSVIGFDFDFGALERAFARFDQSGQNVLPLWLDATNPSPAQGWANEERKSMIDRCNADVVLALADIHHLAIGKNIPLDMAVDWLMGTAKRGVIEFPSKSDPMVKQLLRQREDIFPEYDEAAFLKHVTDRGQILKQDRLGEDGRLIVAFERRD